MAQRRRAFSALELSSRDDARFEKSVLRLTAIAALIAVALLTTGFRERAGRALYHAGFESAAALVLPGAVWDAAAHYAAGRYDEAAATFRTVDFPAQHYDVGTSLARAGKLKDAADAFDYALVVDPNDEDARFNLALVESLLKRDRVGADDRDGAAGASATENRRSNAAASEAEDDIAFAGAGAAGDRDSRRPAQNAGPSKVTRESENSGQDLSGESKKATGSVGSGGGAGRTGDANRNVAKPPEQLAHRLAPMSLKTMAASQRWLETLPDDPGAYLKRRIEHERAARKAAGLAAPELTDPS